MPALELNRPTKVAIESILTKVDAARAHNERMTIITLPDLKQLLSKAEQAIIDQVYALNPPDYGFKGPRAGLEPVPQKLVRVAPRPFKRDGKPAQTHLQFIPEPAWNAFTAMAGALQAELGKELLIESSYRSPAYQAITFLSILYNYDFDLPRTAKRAAIPGYSEHSTPSCLALDLINAGGLPDADNASEFTDTPEFTWLVKNAGKFDFYMSYPKHNAAGIMYEPWHWRHMPW